MKYLYRPMGLLEITGESRLDLINRMSTNLVSLLKPGEGAATVLTTDVGRIIDRVMLYAGESSALMMTGEDNGDNIGRYLMRFVFFNDDFRLNPLMNQFATLFVYGEDAQSELSELSGGTIDLSLHNWMTAEIAGIPVAIHATDPIEGGGYMVKIPVDQKEAVEQALIAQGGEPISEAEFDALRIEAQLPRLRHELTGEFIPLETVEKCTSLPNGVVKDLFGGFKLLQISSFLSMLHLNSHTKTKTPNLLRNVGGDMMLE